MRMAFAMRKLRMVLAVFSPKFTVSMCVHVPNKNFGMECDALSGAYHQASYKWSTGPMVPAIRTVPLRGGQTANFVVCIYLIFLIIVS
jgi:hypothetical protein